ncbi:class I adenylate-forming enzyme family protein [Desertimonas flava]|uniref:class I adenylate-forming enzyme family protein n=1 Tax=Desertimonas flava TaxID=2064846 RepID=UPI000E350B24|nr:AMP-binding protein [Desertimonas flava]
MAELITDALDWWTRALPDRVALDVEGTELTYRDLGAWSDRVARGLIDEHGISIGDVVAIAGYNSLEWCVAAIGVMKAGAIVTPVNFRYTVSEVEYLARDCTPAAVVADETEAVKFAELAARGIDIPVVPTSWIRARQHGDPVAVDIDVDPREPVILAYTSGTTGQPKGLVYTNETVLAGLFELILKDPTPPEATNMLFMLPLFSVAGIVHALSHMMARGGKTVIMRDFDPAAALDLMVRHRISHTNGVPVIYERIAALPDFADHDLSHLVVAQVGGARVSDELLAAFHRVGVALRHMYGMTEVGGCGTVPRPADALAHPELCGDGSIFTEVRTMRPDGTFCDPGEQGEIVMRGPAMMARYWNNEEATAAAIVDGWLHSGDIGIIDERGYLRYVDRLKDLIISGGFNVSPSEVEAVIGSVPGVSEVAVIAVQDQQWGETPAAIVYSDSGFDEQAVRDKAAAELAVFKVPRYVVRSASPLPRMASGKIAKRQLREEYADLPQRQATVGG